MKTHKQTSTNADGYKTLKFASLFDLASFVDPEAPRRVGSSSIYNSSEFAGVSIEKAKECALAGGYWKEGVANMQKAVAALPPAAAKPRARYKTAYAGNRAAVRQFIAGSPKSMLQRVNVPSDKKVIRFAVCSVSCRLDQTDIINRGAAILSVIKEIEADGHAVELTYLFRGVNNGFKYSVECLIKPSNAFFSPADFAFPICNPAFVRRLLWAAAEQHPQLDKASASGYGNGLANTFPDFDLWAPYAMPHSHFGYATPANARKTIAAFVEEQRQASQVAA